MPGPETSPSEEQPSKEEGSQEPRQFDAEAYGRERLEKLTKLRQQEALDRSQEEERLRGFAKLPRKTEEQKMLDRFSAEEKRGILLSLLDREGLPEQVRLRLEQLEMIRTIFEETVSQIEHPKTRAGKGVAWGKRLGIHWAMSKLGFETTSNAMDKLTQEIHAFEEQDLPGITAEMMQGKVTLQEVAGRYPLIQRAAQKYHLDLSDPKTSEDLLKQQNDLVSYLRGAKNYELCGDTIENLLTSELQPTRETAEKSMRTKLWIEAEEKVNPIIEKHIESWRNPTPKMREQGAKPMTPEQIAAYVTGLREERYRKLLMEEVARQFDPASLTGEKQRLWDVYADMLDPKGEWFNIKDATWDMIIDEVAINAPLIIASGGVASGVRATLSTGARMIARRIAAKAAVTTAARMGAKETIAAGAKRVGTWAAGTLVEGATFEAVHSTLLGEFPKDLPEWSQRILWSSATLGLFHGAGKVGERAFTKTVMKDGKQIAETTLLGSYVDRISNRAARETAKQLLVKGHIEAAGMLVMGAAQNGVYNGDLSDFTEHFSDELLHAYVTVGALKIGHAGVETVTGKVFKPAMQKSMEVERQKKAEVQPEKKESIMQETRKPETRSLEEGIIDVVNMGGEFGTMNEKLVYGIHLPESLVPEMERRLHARGWRRDSDYKNQMLLADEGLYMLHENASGRMKGGPYRNEKTFMFRISPFEAKSSAFLEPQAVLGYLKNHPDLNSDVRIAIAEKGLSARGLLKPTEQLSETQKKAILEAHEYGKGNLEEGYAQGEENVKGLKLMRDNVFTREQAQYLLDAGICGKAPEGAGRRTQTLFDYIHTPAGRNARTVEVVEGKGIPVRKQTGSPSTESISPGTYALTLDGYGNAVLRGEGDVVYRAAPGAVRIQAPPEASIQSAASSPPASTPNVPKPPTAAERVKAPELGEATGFTLAGKPLRFGEKVIYKGVEHAIERHPVFGPILKDPKSGGAIGLNAETTRGLTRVESEAQATRVEEVREKSDQKKTPERVALNLTPEEQQTFRETAQWANDRRGGEVIPSTLLSHLRYCRDECAVRLGGYWAPGEGPMRSMGHYVTGNSRSTEKYKTLHYGGMQQSVFLENLDSRIQRAEGQRNVPSEIVGVSPLPNGVAGLYYNYEADYYNASVRPGTSMAICAIMPEAKAREILASLKGAPRPQDVRNFFVALSMGVEHAQEFWRWEDKPPPYLEQRGVRILQNRPNFAETGEPSLTFVEEQGDRQQGTYDFNITYRGNARSPVAERVRQFTAERQQKLERERTWRQQQASQQPRGF